MAKGNGESGQSSRRDGPIIHEGEGEGTEGESASQVLRGCGEKCGKEAGGERRESETGVKAVGSEGRTKERTKEQEVSGVGKKEEGETEGEE